MIISIILCMVGSKIFRTESDESTQEFFYKGVVESE